jgi:hypothetical protein
MPAGVISVFLIKLGATACLCIGAAAGAGAGTVDGGYALTAVAGGTGLARQVHAVAGRCTLRRACCRPRWRPGWQWVPSAATAPRRPRRG